MSDTVLKDDLAEAGVISTLVCHPEFIFKSASLKARHFYNTENGCIYWAITELIKAGVDNIDALNLSNMLNSNKAVSKIMKQNRITDLNEFIRLCSKSSRESIEEYALLAKKVKDLAFKRDYNNMLNELQNECNDEIGLSELSSTTYSKLSKLTQEFVADESVEMFGDKVDRLWQEIESRRTDDGLFGIPSKFPSLNTYITYEPTELILLKARMKKGKSAWMMNEAIHKIKNGVPTVYFDTEMADRLFFERMLANLTNIELKKIKSGDYSKEEYNRIKMCMEWIKEQPFVHIYDPQFTNDKIYADCNILIHKMDLQFVIYDYMKSNTVDSSSQYNELGGKCDFLKNNIAGDLDLAVLAACQLNRNNEVADSDKIERYCSASLLWRNKTIEEQAVDGQNCGNYRLTVTLNRLGEQMQDNEYIDFVFDGSKMRIDESECQHEVAEPEI